MSATLVLKHKFALGDTVCLTALVRDIHRAYPGRYEVLVDSGFREIWREHPAARPVRQADFRGGPVTRVDISYRQGIRQAGRGQHVHMLRAYHDEFRRKTGLDVPLTEPRGDLRLPDDLRLPVTGDYWLLLAGWKDDITNKRYPHWQRVVDMLRERGVHCAQAGARFKRNHHPKLDRVLDLVGYSKSALDFFNLIRHARGVIGPVTAAMHIAACYEKPCVVVAGGREEPWWESYTNAYPGAFGDRCAPVRVEHRFLHTLGLLECCKHKGCWKRRTVPLESADRSDPKRIRDLCQQPTRKDGDAFPACMDMIPPAAVVRAVLSYYRDGEIYGKKPFLAEAAT